jgi:hypothetical protein
VVDPVQTITRAIHLAKVRFGEGDMEALDCSGGYFVLDRFGFVMLGNILGLNRQDWNISRIITRCKMNANITTNW